MGKVGVDLAGVPETLLWQALRAATFDREVRRFAAVCPGGTVVALGEGLETQFWRVDDGRVDWLTVELPETVALQERVLPASPRRRTVAASALDEAWMDAADPSRGLLITAQGLLMYFARAAVHRLLAACAARFPGAALIFDAVPAWLARRDPPKRWGYQPPRWLWGMDAREERALATLPGVTELRALRLPRRRGPSTAWLSRSPRASRRCAAACSRSSPRALDACPTPRSSPAPLPCPPSGKTPV